MQHPVKLFLLSLTFFLSTGNSFSQLNNYILNGSAAQNSCNCYTLTPAVQNQSGSVWNKNKINLTNPFDFWFTVNLGCSDATGADGIVFMLQPISTSVGSSGGGMGFSGISPSIGIALDTYKNSNSNDPDYDHISIQANGNLNHANDLAGPVPISVSNDNVEDCQWHKLRITWNPATKTITTYFDDVLRVSAQVDLIRSIFHNDPAVYWGFTGGTGSLFNVQQFCTALTPDFSTNTFNDGTCIGNGIRFSDKSESFAPIRKYTWNFGDGTTYNGVTPPVHQYNQPGYYNVKLAIEGLDGCSDSMSKKVTIASVPQARLTIFDTCFHKAPRIVTDSNNIGTSNSWKIDGNVVTGELVPLLNSLAAGNHALTLEVSSLFGCGKAVATGNFTLKDIPVVSASFNNTCINVPTQFKALQTDNTTTINQWYWNLGDGSSATTQNLTHTYRNTGTFNTRLWADGSNGCTSDTVTTPVTVSKGAAFAGNDTTVLDGVPFQLNGNGEGSFLWSPATGLSAVTVQHPTATLTEDQTYELTVLNAQGCVAKDVVTITVFKGSAIYVPNAFTPNRDGRNDVLRAKFVGVKKLFYFTIYNRWGQIVFSTTNPAQVWDGTFRGKLQTSASFVWMIKAEDFVGKMYQLKGTVTIIL